MDFKLKVKDTTGVDQIVKRMKQAEDITRVRLKMGKACALVERAAKQKAPKGDGTLRNSITFRVETLPDGNVVGVVFTPLLYAPYVEHGTGLFAEDKGRKDVPWCYKDDEGNWHTTSGQKPQPFLRPALYSNAQEIRKILSEGNFK